MSSTSSWQPVNTTLHFIHNHWNVYFSSPSFVDFCWIWPDDWTIVNWPISFIVITTPMTRPYVNVSSVASWMSFSSTSRCHSSSSSSSSTSTSTFYTETRNGRCSRARECVLSSTITGLLLPGILVGS
jgi:hypothetical protein